MPQCALRVRNRLRRTDALILGVVMDNGDTLLSVLDRKDIEGLLSPGEAMKIKSKLWAVLAGRAESYAMGDSSVRMETAQELLRSVGFVLRHGIGAEDEPSAVRSVLLDGDYDDLFRAGLLRIEALVREGEALLSRVRETAAPIDNKAYRGTLRELGVFFQRYHYHHFAHEIPCLLDYPPAHPVDESLLGIEYINEYLRRLLIENEFMGRFDSRTVTLLLRSASSDYREDLLNMYETVAANALALTLLGGDILSLDVTDRDRSRLLSLIGGWREDTAPTKLRAASDELCGILGIDGDAAREYLALTAQALYARIKQILLFKRLESVFPPLFREPPEKETAVTYVDGALMEDEKLRDLIDALTSCVEIPEKIALARRHIGSLRDWAEVLGICFWGDELKTVFDSFGADELRLLAGYVREKRRKYPGWISETGWEEALLEYVRENNRFA